MRGNPVVYSTSVEGLFVRGLRERMTPRCRERLREAGLDLGRKLEPSYPLERWKEFLRVTVRELFPQHTTEAAYTELGVCFMDGFLETFIGKATVSVLRVLGPRRALSRMSQSLRAGNNFSEVVLKERGPADAELWLNDVFADHPAFAAALIRRGHSACGARDCRVETLGFTGTSATLRIRWEEGLRRSTSSSNIAVQPPRPEGR